MTPYFSICTLLSAIFVSSVSVTASLSQDLDRCPDNSKEIRVIQSNGTAEHQCVCLMGYLLSKDESKCERDPSIKVLNPDSIKSIESRSHRTPSTRGRRGSYRSLECAAINDRNQSECDLLPPGAERSICRGKATKTLNDCWGCVAYTPEDLPRKKADPKCKQFY